MSKKTPQAIRGTQDIFGADAEAFAFVVETFERVRKLYRFRRVEMPVFERLSQHRLAKSSHPATFTRLTPADMPRIDAVRLDRLHGDRAITDFFSGELTLDDGQGFAGVEHYQAQRSRAEYDPAPKTHATPSQKHRLRS